MLDRRKVAQRKGDPRISVTLGCVAVKQEGVAERISNLGPHLYVTLVPQHVWLELFSLLC
jgi:hypothetical protein